MKRIFAALILSITFLPVRAQSQAQGGQSTPQPAAQTQQPVTPQTPPNPEHRNEAQGIMAPKATGPDAAIDKYHYFGSFKARIEDTNYFLSSKANGDYVYGGSLLRFGVRRETHTDDFMLELAVPTLYNPPTKATAPSPQGALGQGATYFASNGSQVASLFPKQLYERFKHVGDSANSLQV